MKKQGGENHSRKQDFLESGKPTNYADIEGENPSLDAITELDKVNTSLRQTHKETQEGRGTSKGKAWVDRSKVYRKQSANNDLIL